MSDVAMNVFDEVEVAVGRLAGHVLTTPLMESCELSEIVGGKVYLKLESEQHTGSFKFRGALNKILSLSDEDKAKGVITASSGNHALGFARALEVSKVRGFVYLPENASPAKVNALKQYDVDIKFYGQDCLVTEQYARQLAEDLQMTWVSPYNDLQIIGGQGTIAHEVTQQCEHIDQIFVTVGGGGLISGVGSYLKKNSPTTKVWACQPENSPEMTLSLKAGKVVQFDEEKETLSDGSAGGIEEDTITFPICQEIVDQTVLVNEDEIALAIKFMAHSHRKIIEGAAGVALAALLKNKEAYRDRVSVVVICGSNIDAEKIKRII